MNLKELIKKCESIAEDETNNGLTRGFYKAILDDLKNLDEVAKVEIPLFAEDVIKVGKAANLSLFWAMNGNGKTESFRDWIEKTENQETFARAWIEGYEVKKVTEKRYIVKLKELRDISSVLRYHKEEDYWEFGSDNEYGPFRTAHTCKELEKGGFGAVFNNPLFEVEEIKTKSQLVNK